MCLTLILGREVLVLGFQEGTPYSNIQGALSRMFLPKSIKIPYFLGLNFLSFISMLLGLKSCHKSKGLCFVFGINDNNREKSDFFQFKLFVE